jgi:hypothetical protein
MDFNIPVKNADKRFGNAIPIILVLVSMILCLFALITNNPIIILGAMITLLISIWVKGNIKRFYIIVIITYFTTEQIYTKVFGGTFRLYFIISIFTILILFSGMKKAFNNRVLKGLLAIIAVLIFTSILSNNILGAFSSSIFVILNMLPAFAVFLILYAEVLSLHGFQDILFSVLLFSIIFGIFQWIFYKITGIPLVISADGRPQLAGSQIPGLWTEANTYGKLVCWSLIYCIPAIIHTKEKKFVILALLSLFTLIISPTRSASYAAIIAAIYGIYWYVKQRKTQKVIKIIAICICIIFIFLFLFQTGIINLEGYSTTKLQNFFVVDKTGLQNDSSGSFRLEDFEAAVRQWQQSFKTIVLGVGFGQAYANLQGGTIYIRVGGNDIMSILVGTGLVGLLVFLISFLLQHFTLKKIIKRNIQFTIIGEQMMLLNIYGFIILFFSGILQTPEYWIVFGISAFLFFKNIENMSLTGRLS